MIHYDSKLTVVGAGPGEIDLITVKGAKALRNAKVVFYDANVNETLLLEYASTAIKIFVGKRRQQEAFSPQDINELILDHAERYGQVVFLKSGGVLDAKEAFYVQSCGLNVEFIPGISSLPEHFEAFTQNGPIPFFNGNSLN